MVFFVICVILMCYLPPINTLLRMPAPVYFSIVGDVPLLRIFWGSGMSDMNVRDGWDITIAVAYC